LVSFGGKIGYDARLDVALNQVFGPGAATQVTPTPAPAAASAGPTAPATGTAQAPAALQGAVRGINGALGELRAAQQSGDFAAQGKALADLDKAIKDFQSVNAAPAKPH
jgi:uncharacterized membrane protein (UPF0182 family)